MFSIPYSQTGYFSKLMIDYLNQANRLTSLYNRFSTLENFKYQIEEKKQSFSIEKRKILVEKLISQYQLVYTSDLTLPNIQHLENENSFTIDTRYQLNL